MLTLYHGRTSVASIKVRIALAEKNLEWEGHILIITGRGDQFDPAYMKLNPNAAVPTLVHDDKVIIESAVILYYLDDVFPTPPLMPPSPHDKSKVYMINKLIDEHVHNACTTLTFATAARETMQKLSKEALEAQLAKTPDPVRVDLKRQVIEKGLDAPIVLDALKHHLRLLQGIEDAMQAGRYLAGDAYSIADIAVTPYIWRLEQLRLAKLWDKRPGIAEWYERIRARPSFEQAINQVVTKEEFDRFANFQPDPWPKVRELIKVV